MATASSQTNVARRWSAASATRNWQSAPVIPSDARMSTSGTPVQVTPITDQVVTQWKSATTSRSPMAVSSSIPTVPMAAPARKKSMRGSDGMRGADDGVRR